MLDLEQKIVFEELNKSVSICGGTFQSVRRDLTLNIVCYLPPNMLPDLLSLACILLFAKIKWALLHLGIYSRRLKHCKLHH